jgi:hypothetical protein
VTRRADQPKSSWDLLESLSEDRWKEVYAAVRRRARRRAAILMLALPIVVGGQIAYLIAKLSDDAQSLPFLANIGVYVIGLAAILLCSVFLFDAVQAMRPGGLVIRGEVLKKLGGTPDEKMLATVIAYLFGMELLMDIEECVVLEADGLGARKPEWRTCRTIGAARRVHRRVAPGEEVVVACGPSGRAFAFVSEFVAQAPVAHAP